MAPLGWFRHRQTCSKLFMKQLAADVRPDWNAVRLALQKCPRVVVCIPDSTARNALHFVCSKDEAPVPLDVVQHIIDLHPDWVKEKTTNGGCLPLHYACIYKQSFEVIYLLVQQHRNGVKEKDQEGYLPLHWACYLYQSFNVVNLLVGQHRDGVKVQDNHGNLPLHLACRTNQSFAVINLLVQQHRNGVKEKDYKGHLPLHWACRYTQSFEVIDLLVRRHQEGVKEKNKEGKTPLDMGIGRLDREIVQWLKEVAASLIDLTASANVKLPPLSPGLLPLRHDDHVGSEGGSSNALSNDMVFAKHVAANDPFTMDQAKTGIRVGDSSPFHSSGLELNSEEKCGFAEYFLQCHNIVSVPSANQLKTPRTLYCS